MSKRKAISVSLAKIDYNFGRPHLYVLAECPRGYSFCRFVIIAHVLINNKWDKKQYDITNLMEGNDGDIILNIPISILEGIGENPAVYNIIMEAEHEDEREIHDEIFISDVHGVYRNLLNGILEDTTCTALSDELVKLYLILYAHQLALCSGDLDVAKDMFKLMHNKFSSCGERKSEKCGCYDRH